MLVDELPIYHNITRATNSNLMANCSLLITNPDYSSQPAFLSQKRKIEKITRTPPAVITHHRDDIPMPMSSGEVEGYVIAEVGGVNASASDHQHVHNGQVTLLGGPVQQREPMVIPVGIKKGVDL